MTHLNAEYVARVVPISNSLSPCSMAEYLSIVKASRAWRKSGKLISAEGNVTHDCSLIDEGIDSPKKMTSGLCCIK